MKPSTNCSDGRQQYCGSAYPTRQPNLVPENPFFADESNLKDYPSELKAIHGKEFTFKIELNEDNILLKSTVYNATDAFDREFTVSSKSEASTSDLEITGYKDKAEDVADNGNTPGNLRKKMARTSYALIDSVRKDLAYAYLFLLNMISS
ncbi:hypothetical protein DCAR_0103956 [Daucus carota subsp. sativus]|uniref:Uncharacterized protein n=1 Tax=Daucus carota subsp. sativus TaxID=79200 RepID=A0A166IF74_DAUCS|nr:hypothetical protein DCAR_0103956 [Daucus carota subsp. sativus]